MKIKLLIRRKSGSSVTLDGVTYKFNDENDHTATVDDEKHARRLLDQVPRVFVEADPASVVDSGKSQSQSETVTQGDDQKSPSDAAQSASTGQSEATTTKAPRKPRAQKAAKE